MALRLVEDVSVVRSYLAWDCGLPIIFMVFASLDCVVAVRVWEVLSFYTSVVFISTALSHTAVDFDLFFPAELPRLTFTFCYWSFGRTWVGYTFAKAGYCAGWLDSLNGSARYGRME